MSVETPTAGHTPGPLAVNTADENHADAGCWRLESKDQHGIVNDGCIIARTEGPDGEANAHRLALAWNAHDELLAALKNVRTLYASLTGPDDAIAQAMLAEIDAAIAKATP